MRFSDLFLATLAAVSGSFSAPVDNEGDVHQLVERQSCLADDSVYSSIFNEATDDFDAKKRSEDPAVFSDWEIPEEELNGTYATLEVRINQHQCTIPNGGANTGVFIADITSIAAVVEGDRRRRLGYAGRAYASNGVNFYPKRFYNNEAISEVPLYCPSGPWFEFPVSVNPLNVFGSGWNRPGTDRVIFDRCGSWCATITHRGELFNNFHSCKAA